MKSNPTFLQRFAEQLEWFRYAPEENQKDSYGSTLEQFRAELPPVPHHPEACGQEEISVYLASVNEVILNRLATYRQAQIDEIAVWNLRVTHSFQILFRHSTLLDALHRFALNVAMGELPLLVRKKMLENEKELERKREQIPQKETQLVHLNQQLESMAAEEGEDSSQREYYAGLANALETSLSNQRENLVQLETLALELAAWKGDRALAEERLTVFARGGYGRAEMSFCSDVDTGYCLDNRGLSDGQVSVFQELVVRVDEVLEHSGVRTVHQYFEIAEDLSRFSETEALHTFPAVLEARCVAGNIEVLDELKARFKALLPFEKVARQKSEEFDQQHEGNLTIMNLKEDFGGLRSIQIPLWLLGMTFKASNFMTMDLLQLARRKELLSMWEVSRLLQALEFLYELRNFVGMAESHYYDREARESGFYVPDIQPNTIDDHLVRLYLFRRHRFSSLDDFDRFRLRLVMEMRRISRKLMQRVLDQTLSQKLAGLRVAVHLGERTIRSIHSVNQAGSADMRALFQDSASLLSLFSYMAQTNYDLSNDLKDGLAGVVTTFTLPVGETDLHRQAYLFSQLMEGRFAHRALSAMFEISDPLTPGMPTLIGRYIPACDEMVCLLRTYDSRALPLHSHSLASLAQGQSALEELQQHYPDLHALLEEGDVLALKWALFLHDIARVEYSDAAPARSAEQAVEVLNLLGYTDSLLEEKVRLLISHHRTLAELSRMATYMDQAMAQYYEVANHTLSNVVLLFLTNLAVIRAKEEEGPAEGEGGAASLRALFDEANQIVGEMRGFPLKEQSLEMINVYFDKKKYELIEQTRLHLLFQEIMAHGLAKAVSEPLRDIDEAVWRQVEEEAGRLDRLHKEIALGAHERAEQVRLESKLILSLRRLLSEKALMALTAHQGQLLEWFFASVPNRYLMVSLPADLAGQMLKFAAFREARAIVDLSPNPYGGTLNLLIYTNGLSRSHSRVAYTLSRSRLNVVSGKINRVELADGGHGYCYFFQVSRLEPGTPLQPGDLELMIVTGEPPFLSFPEPASALSGKRVRLEFLGDDGKGYVIREEQGGFRRIPISYRHLMVVLRDEPFLFYKVAQAFDLFDIDLQQALITTTGNQVVDYFYFSPPGYDRLRGSDFEERFIQLTQSELMDVLR